jgi:hypothetical protein
MRPHPALSRVIPPVSRPDYLADIIVFGTRSQGQSVDLSSKLSRRVYVEQASLSGLWEHQWILFDAVSDKPNSLFFTAMLHGGKLFHWAFVCIAIICVPHVLQLFADGFRNSRVPMTCHLDGLVSGRIPPPPYKVVWAKLGGASSTLWQHWYYAVAVW